MRDKIRIIFYGVPMLVLLILGGLVAMAADLFEGLENYLRAWVSSLEEKLNS